MYTAKHPKRQRTRNKRLHSRIKSRERRTMKQRQGIGVSDERLLKIAARDAAKWQRQVSAGVL